jgi:hypothetical protein
MVRGGEDVATPRQTICGAAYGSRLFRRDDKHWREWGDGQPINTSLIVVVRLRFKFCVHSRRASCGLSLQTAAATSLALNRMISMAIAHQAHCADVCRGLARSQPWTSRLLPLSPKLLAISVVVLATGLGGCARNTAHRDPNPVAREAKAPPVRSPVRARAHPETRQNAELLVRRPDAALLEPQLAPDCEFKRADLKVVDPDEWARLKTEYERQCYRDAERLARERLSQLQVSASCEVERVPQRRPVR